MILLIPVILTGLLEGSQADLGSSNYFCADLSPQQNIIMDQLMGMWYGIEIISHDDEQEYVQYKNYCPVIHLSTQQNRNPYNNRDRQYGYGNQEQGYNNYNTNYGTHQYGSEGYQRNHQYHRNTQYNYNPENYNLGNSTYSEYVKKLNKEIKKLRLWWDQSGTGTEYHLWYNYTFPGMWTIYEPDSRQEQREFQITPFNDKVQVLKAVGNHLVLTFCQKKPEKKLFSILLSRETKLEYLEIKGVRGLLDRKGLRTTAIKKVCNKGFASKSTILFVVVLVVANKFI